MSPARHRGILAVIASGSRAARRGVVAAVLAVATTLSGLSPAAAQSEYRWDTSADAGIQSGNGVWSETIANWTLDDGVTRVAWDNSVLSNAEFGANNKTATLTGDITVNRIRTFNSTNLTISEDPALVAIGITSKI
jgi:hypothetical protein